VDIINNSSDVSSDDQEQNKINSSR